MLDGVASATAFGAAMMRAAHLVLDDDPKVHVDPYAERFLDERRRALMHDRTVMGTTATCWSRANIVARAAFTDAALVDALDAGCEQVVVLGAGLDSTALRLADRLSAVPTFEVDHPATQAYKRRVLAELDAAEHVRFAPVDFERDSLAAALAAAGWDPARPTFWSWLGVTMYLTDAAIFATLGFVATSAPGSVVVTNYSVHADDMDPDDVAVRERSAEGVARSGEPWLSFFRHADMVERTRALGFAEVTSLDHREMDGRYFAGRTDGLTWRSPTAMLVARRGAPLPVR